MGGKSKAKQTVHSRRAKKARGVPTGIIRNERPAQNYINRTKAMARLGVKLPDFRRLCILKGVYPRDPKSKKLATEKTYYHVKDISFLSHEPLLRKFFEIKAFVRKFKKVQHKMGAEKRMPKMEERLPKYTLHHIVLERYPSFDAALQDMDDAMCMLALFAALPANQFRKIPPKDVQESIRLYQEFQLYCIKSRCLRRMFCSIKGYYWQASIQGVSITWVQPHQFAQDLPWEVDFEVMLTFLEFYRTLMKFVNFRLFSMSGFAYPPRRDEVAEKSAAGVAALELVALEKENAQNNIVTQAAAQDKEVNDFADTEEGRKMQEAKMANDNASKLFEGLKFFISREVPLGPLYFLLKCGGAAVGFATEASPFSAEDEGITHMLVDRPPEHLKIVPGREYVQPQWAFDSFNCGVRLPIAPYAPGKAPPAHLSPFVDDAAEGYVPKQREVLNALIQQRIGAPATKVKRDEGLEGDVSDEEEEVEQQFQAELDAEAKGIWHADYQADKAAASTAAPSDSESEQPVDPKVAKKLAKAEHEKQEELKRRQALLSAKSSRLYNAIQMGKAKKDDELKTLQQKRKAVKKQKKGDKKPAA
mmetsp:Transcript_28481/g.68507  ORF Transcript_28481/g.68507 Transcript_28481/m.68507 type:complete len:589 (+) Transcript_28481:86-1852(+)